MCPMLASGKKRFLCRVSLLLDWQALAWECVNLISPALQYHRIVQAALTPGEKAESSTSTPSLSGPGLCRSFCPLGRPFHSIHDKLSFFSTCGPSAGICTPVWPQVTNLRH
jgi:hypothetical protein